jgi:hypothetical protein
MSRNEIDSLTHHAMLVAWGQFAQSIGLVEAIESLPLHQKGIRHRPQTKILEFFVAILAGLEHLKDLSRSAHPIDQDQAVATAWHQPAWADYSGVSRSLAALTQEESEQIAAVLDACSGPCRPSIPMDAVHSFRAMPTTCSDNMASTFSGTPESVDGIVRIQWTACSGISESTTDPIGSGAG